MKNQFFSVTLILLCTTVLAACASTDFLTPTTTPSLEPLPTADFSNQQPFEEAFPGEFSNCILSSGTENTSFPVPPISAEDHWQGAQDATLELIVYLDPQCPYCAGLQPVLDALLKEYPTQLQIAYRQMPLIMIHQNALLAAQALEAAALQNPEAYFTLQQVLYAEQPIWEALPEAEFQTYLLEKTQLLELDPASFTESYLDPALQAQLLADLDAALQAGITYTPFVLINGQSYGSLPLDLNTLRTVLELTRLEERQFSSCPPQLIEEGKQYTATLLTDKGEITLELFPETAPLALNNFIFLSEQGWYENIPFYRVLPNSFALTGDPTGSSMGGPGYTFRSEIDPAINFSLPGMVAMNNAGAPNTNGSQFFITLQPLSELNGKFTIFGQVIAGFEILQQLTPRDPLMDSEIIQPDMLLSVTIDSK